MGLELPAGFASKMKGLLAAEFDDFMASYDAKRWYGLRVNRLKLTPQAYAALAPEGLQLSPIPWVEEGFYYEETARPGKHPHYHAGLYYIQEPSAMVPAELLDVQPGHRVLDLCAAPGGKSTQLAGKLGGEGLLVANDNARERTKALAKNIELAGVRNAIVLHEEPAALAEVFGAYFDRILVDAPCSGEGMFRKDESMIRQWERHSVEHCARMQEDILNHAARMLAPGGRLVYSTCTFSPEENEERIAALLARHPELSVEAVPLAHGWQAGQPQWTAAAGGSADERHAAAQVAGTVRLWPHHVRGEGHYAAVLRKAEQTPAAVEPLYAGGSDLRAARSGSAAASAAAGGTAPGVAAAGVAVLCASEPGLRRERPSGAQPRGGGAAVHGSAGAHRGAARDRRAASPAASHSRQSAAAAPQESWRQFAASYLHGAGQWPGRLVNYGSRVYCQPAGVPELDGLHVVRAGWYLGEAGKHRFEPSQALAMGLRAPEALLTLQLTADCLESLRYLKGETLHIAAEQIRRSPEAPQDMPLKGYVLVCIDGFPVGWGKWDGGMLKNELSAGWRWT
ncbi:RsmB/NOP family class I SAM-dependent RNA methyltransferase [Paenibacillus sp. SYP-B4298]|uniref:RsmB/NOP family class I SAM-dependent RNA methyltransferase n=1 Tax=Paenibacillus sp. SYP-B4298 TaxID=2996034 RepID=UPI0022DE4520|nr:RsmB/NOP family class I SAM-dependent RNA methyltransferase [Paenibacillus sp. SYP-B4298]